MTWDYAAPSPVSTLAAPALSLVPSQEEAMLRETVSSIAASFGPEYTRRINTAGGAPPELWDALASRRHPGVQPPAEDHRRGLGVAARATPRAEVPAARWAALPI